VNESTVDPNLKRALEQEVLTNFEKKHFNQSYSHANPNPHANTNSDYTVNNNHNQNFDQTDASVKLPYLSQSQANVNQGQGNELHNTNQNYNTSNMRQITPMNSQTHTQYMNGKKPDMPSQAHQLVDSMHQMPLNTLTEDKPRDM